MSYEGEIFGWVRAGFQDPSPAATHGALIKLLLELLKTGLERPSAQAVKRNGFAPEAVTDRSQPQPPAEPHGRHNPSSASSAVSRQALPPSLHHSETGTQFLDSGDLPQEDRQQSGGWRLRTNTGPHY